MPQSTANYGRINPDGTVSGTFPGGIEVPTFDQQVGIAPIRPGVGVRWTEQPDGALLADMTTTAWHKPGAGTPRNVEWELTVTTDPANSGAATAGAGGLSIFAADGSIGGAAVRASASKLTGGSQSVLIIDDEEASDFFQLESKAAWPFSGSPVHLSVAVYDFVNVPMAAGVSALLVYPIPSGRGIVGAASVFENPTGHWQYIMHPHPTEIVCQNNGVAQTLVNWRVFVYYV